MKNKYIQKKGHLHSNQMLAAVVKKGSKMTCEDAARVDTIAPDTFLLQVADGHGGDIGKDCAEYCVQKGHEQILALPADYPSWTKEQWQTHADTTMDEMHQSFLQKYLDTVWPGDYKPYRVDQQGVLWRGPIVVHGGSTYSRVLVFPIDTGFRTVILQVGDSDIYVNGVCQSEDASAYSQMHYDRIQATIPANMRLMQVYDQSNVRLKQLCAPVFKKDGTRDPYYTEDVWNKKKNLHPSNAKYDVATYYVSQAANSHIHTCIAMGASIGDYYAQCQGVTHRGTVKIIDTPTVPHVYVASDGATDLLNKDEIWTSPRQGTIGGVDMKPLMEKHGIMSPCPEGVDLVARQTAIQRMVEEHVEQVHCVAGELFGMRHIDDSSEAVLIP